MKMEPYSINYSCITEGSLPGGKNISRDTAH